MAQKKEEEGSRIYFFRDLILAAVVSFVVVMFFLPTPGEISQMMRIWYKVASFFAIFLGIAIAIAFIIDPFFKRIAEKMKALGRSMDDFLDKIQRCPVCGKPIAGGEVLFPGEMFDEFTMDIGSSMPLKGKCKCGVGDFKE